MAFEGLADRLQGTLQRIRGKGKVTEADVKEQLIEIIASLEKLD